MFELTPFRRRETGLGKPFNSFDMNSVFENFFNDAVLPSFYSNSGQMKVDIKENKKGFLVEAELPGIKKEEIGVELENNLLTISVEHKEEINEDNEKYIRKERRYGTMKRSFVVENVDDENISAKFENGILSLVLSKKNPELKKVGKIQIQ